MFVLSSQQIILLLDTILPVSIQQFWKNLQEETFKFNTKQSFVGALTWHGQETFWKAPLQTASVKKQVSTRKLPGLLFLI